MNKIISFSRLARFDKPIGILLLLWPTLSALWLASNGFPNTYILVVFIVGVFVGLWYHLAPFWLEFGLRGVPGEPLGTLCGTPVAQVTQKCDFWFILGLPWASLWDPVGIIFRLWTPSGGPRGAFWQHFCSMWSPFGFHVNFRPQK